MRIRVVHNGFSVHAIAGTEVVLFGLDLPRNLAQVTLGFGFERIDEETQDRQPLRGLKTFQATEPQDHRPGTPVSTLDHPIQAFLWGDYLVEADRDYTYRVLAFGGTPEQLEPLAEVVVPVQTEAPHRGKHGVYFNRGAAASQAYQRQFQNRHPKDVPNRRAWKWLSRGLEEALLQFIGRAAPRDHLRAAMYEFHYPAVLEAFRAARDRGVDVRIVVDAKRNQQKDSRTGERHDLPREPNLQAIADAQIDDIITRRETNPSYIAHNKFIVHSRAGQPVAVWTGSTNVTAGGIFGHSNVGHVVRDPAVAAQFLAYWEELAKDPGRSDVARWTELATVPTGKPTRGIKTLFSPRKTTEALEWYARLMDGARKSAFFTAAFGISAPIRAVLERDVDYLRYGLLERDDDKIELLKRDSDNVFTVGTRIGSAIGGWAEESLTGLNGHVRYIHTKFMLIDPLSSDPIVITGSANFSNASTRENDENMLIIRGDTRVADIYLTEFMRLFNHFEFRQRVAEDDLEGGQGPVLAGARSSPTSSTRATLASGEPATQGLRHLDPVPGWALEHYHPGWRRTKERLLFR
jgi:phosphatidylserine/phosphatidylglycerophosphate/cardiolipin synthase-like enzyme